MMKERRLLIVLLAALLVFSLFGCGKKEDAPAVDPATSDSSVETGTAGTAGNTGSESTGPSADKLASLEQQEKTAKTELQGDDLFALFKKFYDEAKECQKMDKEYGTDFYKKYSDPSVSYAQQRDIGTLEDANVYYFISKAVHGLMADGFGSDPDYFNNYVLPSDGFEQYVAWREAQTSSSTPSGNTSSSGSQSNQPSSGNNSGSGNTGSGTGSSGGNSGSSGASGGEGENAPGNGGPLPDWWIEEQLNRPEGGTTPDLDPDLPWNRVY